MAMIPDDEIERIKRGTDLAAVVRSRGIELKPSGGDLVGLCPFHDDHHPSLRVTPGKGLWRCMATACGATGNVIQFVQRFDGVSFRHAFELLKSGKLSALSGPVGAPLKRATIPKLENPVAPDADDQAALRQVLDYYHARLKENPDALAYLQKRGITAEAIATFKIGFVDRTLGLRLPQKNRKEGAELRARLARLGVMRDTGHEHLRGRVVFPVIAENGEIGAVYGRAIGKVEKPDRHAFLPGPMRGIWNPLALRSPDVIVTEGIIDALTWWCAGFRHVTTAYSSKHLPDELLDALIAVKVRRVFLSYDRDPSGDEGTAAVAPQLAAHGIECLRVMFPPGQDANEYASKVTPPEKSLGLLLRSALPVGDTRRVAAPSADASRAPSSLVAEAAKAAPLAPTSGATDTQPLAPTSPAAAPEAAREKTTEPAAQPPTPANVPPAASVATSEVVVAKNDAEALVLVIGDRGYRICGLAKNTGFESLKVTLSVTVRDGERLDGRSLGEGRWHLDQLDLCVARQREHFVNAAAVETNLKPELLKRDLGKILGKLEEMQEERLKAEAAPKKIEPELPVELRERALALLRDSRLWELIGEHAAACGIAGERVNVRVGYLGAVSRLLDRPLAIIIQSSSAAGKTTLMDATLAFVPGEARIKYSAMTGQSLFYMGGVDLRHKILAIVEEEGAEKASYALKLLQSEHELRIASTGKNPQTGRMETQEYHVQGPTMIFLTTTSHTLDEELQNRCLVLTVDESREQTERIHALQREARTETGLVRRARRDELLAVHRAAQSLLRPLPVFNPYAEKLRFLSHQLRTRRDHEKYLLLIDSLALLFQHQRERKKIEGREHVVATLDDIARANELAHEVLGRGLDEMPPQTRRLLGLVQEMERARAKKTKGGGHWRRRDLRAFCGWSDTALKVHLARLVELEYVLPSRDPDHLNGQLYELMFDGDVSAAKPHLSGLIDVEALRKHGYDENRSGQNDGQSAVGQGSVSGQSGAGQPGENTASSSENAAPHASAPENARPGTDEKHAA